MIGWHALAGSGRTVDELATALAEVQPGRDGAGLRYRAKSLSLMDPDVLAMVIDERAYAGYDTDALLQRIRRPVLLVQCDPALGACWRTTRRDTPSRFWRAPPMSGWRGSGIRCTRPSRPPSVASSSSTWSRCGRSARASGLWPSVRE
jgi:hypothetical protein